MNVKAYVLFFSLSLMMLPAHAMDDDASGSSEPNLTGALFDDVKEHERSDEHLGQDHVDYWRGSPRVSPDDSEGSYEEESDENVDDHAKSNSKKEKTYLVSIENERMAYLLENLLTDSFKRVMRESKSNDCFRREARDLEGRILFARKRKQNGRFGPAIALLESQLRNYVLLSQERPSIELDMLALLKKLKSVEVRNKAQLGIRSCGKTLQLVFTTKHPRTAQKINKQLWDSSLYVTNVICGDREVQSYIEWISYRVEA